MDKRGLAQLVLPLLLTLVPVSVGLAQQADGNAPGSGSRTAVIIPLQEMIDPLSGALLQRKFQEAIESGVDVVVLDIHSPGGHTSVTMELMDLVLDATQVETVAFIEKDALSGAALLALACDKIIMLPAARIGDAGEIVMGPDGAFRYTEAKSRSALAQKVRDTARQTGKPIALAEKMVDKDMVVFEAKNKATGQTTYFSDREWAALDNAADWDQGRPIREAGKEMFFICNGSRAVEFGLADRTIQNREQLADALGVKSPIRVMERTSLDTVLFVLNTNVVAFLLIAIGLIALTIELGAPGVGIGGLISLLCFSLFFWSRFLGGTAGWLEVTLFVVGLAFIAAELFLIPGFGVAGVGGITLVLGSLIMASRRVLIPENSEQLTALGLDALTVIGAFIGFLIALLFLSNYLGEIPGLSRLTLKPPVVADATGTGFAVTAGEALPGWQYVEVGMEGKAISPLRPSGKMQLGDYTVDVVSDGDFVEAGNPVKVVAKQGSRVVVRAI